MPARASNTICNGSHRIRTAAIKGFHAYLVRENVADDHPAARVPLPKVPERLPDVMAAEGYYLQSLIYLVALHRYLRHRLPGYDPVRHLGGVYYLFLRGMDPERGPASGVYRDRPDLDLLDHLDRYLATGQEA